MFFNGCSHFILRRCVSPLYIFMSVSIWKSECMYGLPLFSSFALSFFAFLFVCNEAAVAMFRFQNFITLLFATQTFCTSMCLFIYLFFSFVLCSWFRFFRHFGCAASGCLSPVHVTHIELDTKGNKYWWGIYVYGFLRRAESYHEARSPFERQKQSASYITLLPCVLFVFLSHS